MQLTTADGTLLTWDDSAAAATVTARRAPDVATTICFATEGHAGASPRVCVKLVLLGRRLVDLSIQPGVVGPLLGCEGPDPHRGEVAEQVAGWLVDFCTERGAWRPTPPTPPDLITTVGGTAFPLLGAAYDHGAAALREVPRWAAPALAQASARDAARLAFDTLATRPVVASLAASAVTAENAADHRVALYPLALGLMGAPVLDPDRLSRVLRAGGRYHPPEVWPDREQVEAGRRLTPLLGARRTERVLVDAATLGDGPQMLSEALTNLALVRHRLPRRIPNRLTELRDLCRHLLPNDPNPGGLLTPPRPPRRRRAAPLARAAPPQVPVRPAAAPPPLHDDRRYAAFRPPVTPAPRVVPNLVLTQAPVVAALHGQAVGTGLRLVVPRTAAELNQWSGRLNNCVGSYATAVSEGRSWVIGIEANDRLVYCIEVRPSGTIRQFVGFANRPVPRDEATTVVRHLVAAGVVAADHADNRPWLGLPAGA